LRSSKAHSRTPSVATLFGAATVTPRPLTLGTVSLFFELSLGLSARKEVASSSWYLRMNPSSGNLHPTEAYAVLPAIEELPGGAGVYHYAPLQHALEQRARWQQGAISDTTEFHVGLTSIAWREAWKYGERAFRYCQHDVGHALAALRFAAAALGWRVQLMPDWNDAQIARLLGLDRAEDFVDAEREAPELMVRVMVNETAATTGSPAADTDMDHVSMGVTRAPEKFADAVVPPRCQKVEQRQTHCRSFKRKPTPFQFHHRQL